MGQWRRCRHTQMIRCRLHPAPSAMSGSFCRGLFHRLIRWSSRHSRTFPWCWDCWIWTRCLASSPQSPSRSREGSAELSSQWTPSHLSDRNTSHPCCITTVAAPGFYWTLAKITDILLHLAEVRNLTRPLRQQVRSIRLWLHRIHLLLSIKLK